MPADCPLVSASLPARAFPVVGRANAVAGTPPGAVRPRVLRAEYGLRLLRQDDLSRPALYADHVIRRLVAWWQWFRASTARDVIMSAFAAAVLVAGSYGEAHPNQPSDRAVFRQHAIPHMPAAALLLVAVACLALAFKRRAPVVVLLVSTAAVVTYTAFGFVNGAALLAP